MLLIPIRGHGLWGFRLIFNDDEYEKYDFSFATFINGLQS